MGDFDLNTFYFYFRQTFPFWLNSKEYNIPQEYRGIFYLYVHQQLIARYYLERLSNDLGEIEDFNLEKPFYSGFYSSMIFSNGVVMPPRKSYYNVPYYKYQYLKVCGMRIENTICYNNNLLYLYSFKFLL